MKHLLLIILVGFFAINMNAQTEKNYKVPQNVLAEVLAVGLPVNANGVYDWGNRTAGTKAWTSNQKNLHGVVLGWSNAKAALQVAKAQKNVDAETIDNLTREVAFLSQKAQDINIDITLKSSAEEIGDDFKFFAKGTKVYEGYGMSAPLEEAIKAQLQLDIQQPGAVQTANLTVRPLEDGGVSVNFTSVGGPKKAISPAELSASVVALRPTYLPGKFVLSAGITGGTHKFRTFNSEFTALTIGLERLPSTNIWKDAMHTKRAIDWWAAAEGSILLDVDRVRTGGINHLDEGKALQTAIFSGGLSLPFELEDDGDVRMTLIGLGGLTAAVDFVSSNTAGVGVSLGGNFNIEWGKNFCHRFGFTFQGVPVGASSGDQDSPFRGWNMDAYFATGKWYVGGSIEGYRFTQEYSYATQSEGEQLFTQGVVKVGFTF
ncbi:MAG: hypothetical protein P8P30_05790 [Rickettsiales bacterium]|nr:hypothetical protein [Rickettsiales bacterium]